MDKVFQICSKKCKVFNFELKNRYWADLKDIIHYKISDIEFFYYVSTNSMKRCY